MATPATTGTQRTAKQRKPKRTVGRPTELGERITLRDGSTGTVAQAIVDRVRTGLPADQAALSAGVTADTLRAWRRRAGDARRLLAADPDAALTAHQDAYLRFADDLDQAEAEALAIDWTRLGMLAAGDLPVEKTVTTVRTDAAGETVTTHVVQREKTLPSESALTWRLRKRWPHLFGDRVEVTGAGGGPLEVDVVAGGLADRLRQIVEATGTEIVAKAGEVPPPAD